MEPITTKRRALLLCLEIWMWLAKTGRSKDAFISTKTNFEERMFWMCMKEKCPCCEYVIQTDPEKEKTWDCTRCPMDWGKPDVCYLPPSPFFKWEHSSNATLRKKYAQEIVQLTKDALKREGVKLIEVRKIS